MKLRTSRVSGRFVCLVLALGSFAKPALAQPNDGRLHGDVTFEAALGGGVTFEGIDPSGAGVAELRLRYLDAAGLTLGGEWRPDGTSRLTVMADLRPLFLPRFFLGAQVGERYVDVLIDSIGLDLGIAIGPLDAGVGVALAIGFGVSIPLVFFYDGGYEGLAIRLFARHVAARPDDRFGPNGGLNDWIIGAVLVLRFTVESGLVEWEPARYRTR